MSDFPDSASCVLTQQVCSTSMQVSCSWWKPGVLCLPDKHPTNRAIFQGCQPPGKTKCSFGRHCLATGITLNTDFLKNIFLCVWESWLVHTKARRKCWIPLKLEMQAIVSHWHRYWEINLGPLKKQQMFLTILSSLQFLNTVLNPHVQNIFVSILLIYHWLEAQYKLYLGCCRFLSLFYFT